MNSEVSSLLVVMALAYVHVYAGTVFRDFNRTVVHRTLSRLYSVLNVRCAML